MSERGSWGILFFLCVCVFVRGHTLHSFMCYACVRGWAAATGDGGWMKCRLRERLFSLSIFLFARARARPHPARSAMGLFAKKPAAQAAQAAPAAPSPHGLPVFESHSGALWVDGTRLKLKGACVRANGGGGCGPRSSVRANLATHLVSFFSPLSLSLRLGTRAPCPHPCKTPHPHHPSLFLFFFLVLKKKASTGLAWRPPTASCTACGAARWPTSWTLWRPTASTPCACPSPSSWWRNWTP